MRTVVLLLLLLLAATACADFPSSYTYTLNYGDTVISSLVARQAYRRVAGAGYAVVDCAEAVDCAVTDGGRCTSFYQTPQQCNDTVSLNHLFRSDFTDVGPCVSSSPYQTAGRSLARDLRHGGGRYCVDTAAWRPLSEQDPETGEEIGYVVSWLPHTSKLPPYASC